MEQFEKELQNRAEAFVALVAQEQQHPTHKQELALKTFLEASYSRDASEAIVFLLRYADKYVVRQFTYNYLYSGALPDGVKTDIIVRSIPKEMKMRGNIGRFLVYTRFPDGTEVRLKFTNKSASVYYLMHLIDRHHKNGKISPLSLRKNRSLFVALYCMVYDISHSKADEKCERLLFRREGGHLRAGRENEIIFDIRSHLKSVFQGQTDSFAPYAMTARSHLTVPSEHIHFFGDAEALLEFHFK